MGGIFLPVGGWFEAALNGISLSTDLCSFWPLLNPNPRPLGRKGDHPSGFTSPKGPRTQRIGC